MARVAILTAEFAPFRGGIATFVEELAAAAVELGHDVTVFAPDYRQSQADNALRGFSVLRYRAGPYSGRWYPAYLSAAQRVARAKFDHVLAADIASIDALSLARALRGTIFDAFIHGSEVVRGPSSLKGRILQPLRIFRAPRRIFANSGYVRGLLLANHPYVDPGRVKVAPLGVAPHWFEAASGSALRARLRIEEDERIVSCVGRITPRKGQMTLLEAIMGTALDRPGLAFVIAGSASEGDGEYRDALHAAAPRVGKAKVVFAEDLSSDEIRALHAEAELFCLPGSARTVKVEGFGLAFLEAAAQGSPSVAGAVGGVPEVVRDGVTGRLVAPDDAHALGEAISGLLGDPALGSRMGTAARLAAREFSWQHCARTIFGEASSKE